MHTPAIHNEVDEPLEGSPLLATIEPPEGSVLEGTIVTGERHAEQVLETSIVDERVRLDVKKDVARRGLGEPGKAEPGLGREELVERPARPPARELDAGLRVGFHEGFLTSACGPLAEWRLFFCEPLERVDPLPLYLVDVEGADARDEAEMVVFVPLGIALFRPAAGVAIGDRVGVSRVPRRSSQHFFESLPDEPVVCLEVRKSESLRREPIPGLHDVHPGRGAPLQPPHNVGVEAELENRAASRVLRELGVDDLIGPPAQIARLRNPQEHVRTTAPATVAQLGLDDGVGAVAHGCANMIGRGRTINVPQLDHGEAARAEVFDVGPFVSEAAFLKERERGILPGRGPDPALRDGTVEFGQVFAREMVREVTCR